MNELLAIFIAVLLLFVVMSYGVVKTIRIKSMTVRDCIAIGIWSIISICAYTVGSYGYKLNEKLANQVRIESEFLSYQNPVDDALNDSILLSYLKDMRVSHASIILAQAKLESDNYTSELFQENRNLFGMKVAMRRTTTSTTSIGGYQAYCNWRESVMDYAFWQFSNNIDKLSNEEYLDYLGKKYATDPNYIIKLKKIIK